MPIINIKIYESKGRESVRNVYRTRKDDGRNIETNATHFHSNIEDSCKKSVCV